MALAQVTGPGGDPDRLLAAARVFRLLLPRSLGGLEVDPLAFSRVEEVAGFDSAAGWALQAGNTGDWGAARFPTAGADEIYAAAPSTVTAAAFHPPQQATAADGGAGVSDGGPLTRRVWTVTALSADRRYSLLPPGSDPG